MGELHAFWLIIRDGVYHIHLVPFVVIAFFAGFLVRSAPWVVVAALAGAVVYTLAVLFQPVLLDGQAFKRPHLNHLFWYFFMSLSIAMTAAIAAIYAVRKAFSSMFG
jgi:hypothetical protein